MLKEKLDNVRNMAAGYVVLNQDVQNVLMDQQKNVNSMEVAHDAKNLDVQRVPRQEKLRNVFPMAVVFVVLIVSIGLMLAVVQKNTMDTAQLASNGFSQRTNEVL